MADPNPPAPSPKAVNRPPLRSRGVAANVLRWRRVWLDLVFHCLWCQNGQVGSKGKAESSWVGSIVIRWFDYRERISWVFLILEGLGIGGLVSSCHRPLWLMRCHWPGHKRHWLGGTIPWWSRAPLARLLQWHFE